MVQEMVVTLREGGETSLMLALLFSSLKAAGQIAYRLAAWLGFALALLLSVVAGMVLRDVGALGPVFEGSLAWLGAGFVGSLALQLHLQASGHRAALREMRDSAAAPGTSWATAFAIGSFAFVSVIREGLETAVFLSNGPGLASQGRWLGAGVGLALAAAFGIAIYAGFRKLDVRSFMKTTEILLLALVFSLVVTGIHEFAEAGLLVPPQGVDHLYLRWFQSGAFLQLLLCCAPFLYLFLTRAKARHYAPALGIASLLAVTPSSLQLAARGWERAQLNPAERAAEAHVGKLVRARSHALVAALESLRAGVFAGDVDGARRSWIEGRRWFVQLEPYLAQSDPEQAEEMNGEEGEMRGFHGVEPALFERGAPWARSGAARSALREGVLDLLARARIATSALREATYGPRLVCTAWSNYRWTFLQRADGEESAASQTSMLEFAATLDALDADLGLGASAPIRLALGDAPARSQQGAPYSEYVPEARVPEEDALKARARVGPDRVWDDVDREPLRRAIQRVFDAAGRSRAPERV